MRAAGRSSIRDPQPMLAGNNPVSTLGAAFGKDERFIWFAQRFGAWEYNAGLPQYQLMTFDRQTGRRENRANMYGSAFRPALSPDGKYLVYGSRYETQTGLRIRDLETSEERWLAYPVQRDEQEAVASLDVLPGYSFTPDSKAIVVSYGGKIWRVPATCPSAQAAAGGAGDSRPDPSCAATQIPFRVRAQIGLGPKVAFNYKVDDSPEFTVRQIRDAVPSPDGKRLAFVSTDKLYVMDYPGGTPRRLTTDLPGNEAQPAWSPDGQSIAFVAWTREGGQLYKVPAAGGKPTQLTTGNALYLQPSWSPDGKRVVALRSPAQTVRESGGFIGAAELVGFPPAGGKATLITQRVRQARAALREDTSPHLPVRAGRGLVSIRWDGTDERTHVRVTGARSRSPHRADRPARRPAPCACRPTAIRRSPRSVNDLFVVTVPSSGERADASARSTRQPEFPARKLTEIGGQFPTWSGDGQRVHWSIGNAHFVYDLDRARQFDDSVRRPIAPAHRRRQHRRGRQHAAAGGRGAGANPRGTSRVEIARSRSAHARDMPQGDGRAARRAHHHHEGQRGDRERRHRRRATIASWPSARPARVQVPNGARVDRRQPARRSCPASSTRTRTCGLRGGIHRAAVVYLANLAYGVTTTRDPQTGTTDVLTYEDASRPATCVGPRIYSTGPGVFSCELSERRGHPGPGARASHHALQRVLRHEDAQEVHGGQPPAAAVDHQAAREQKHHADDRRRARLSL